MNNALLSLYDKTGLEEFAAGLAAMGWRLIASGGTAQAVREAQISVTDVSALTGSPEILGGRVKTLHPMIHGGILARNIISDLADLERQGIEMIDLVACNLYPFQQTVARKSVTLAEAIEEIDIGGITLLRAAAKNFHRVIVVCDPSDYPLILDGLEQGTITLQQRQKLAIKAFSQTRDYDIAIVQYFQGLS